MITSYTLFLESTFSNIAIDDIDYDVRYLKDEFLDDAKLLPKIYIPKFDKEIYLRWYDTADHSIKDKINVRTPANSISEFNEILNDSLIILFEKYFKEISKKMSQYKNRIAVYIPDLYTYVVIEYDVDTLYDDFTSIHILTVVPQVTPRTINRIFKL